MHPHVVPLFKYHNTRVDHVFTKRWYRMLISLSTHDMVTKRDTKSYQSLTHDMVTKDGIGSYKSITRNYDEMTMLKPILDQPTCPLPRQENCPVIQTQAGLGENQEVYQDLCLLDLGPKLDKPPNPS